MPTVISNQNRDASPPETRRGRVCLLADDLTGACDAGVAFLSAGCRVRVWCGAAAAFPAPETVQAFNTASRGLSADEAASAVSRAATDLNTEAGAVFFKKIDSAGRGPIAQELLAAHRTLGTRAILFAPAFPAAGRTVRTGILEVQDASGQNSRTVLADLFPSEIQHKIARVARAGDLAAAIESGSSVLLCDSATQEELGELARIAETLDGLLYAGSAGLARAIASLHLAPAPAAPRAAASRVLVIAGTPHPVTRLQMERLEQEALGQEGLRILRVECKQGDDAEIRAVFEAFKPEALILTGGDTALLAAEALGVHSILLHGEFADGIPWGTAQGGVAQGHIIVTKSGGFGSATTLHELVAQLQGAA